MRGRQLDLPRPGGVADHHVLQHQRPAGMPGRALAKIAEQPRNTAADGSQTDDRDLDRSHFGVSIKGVLRGTF